MCSMETAAEEKWQDVKELDMATTGTTTLCQTYHLSQFQNVIDIVDSLCCGPLSGKNPARPHICHFFLHRDFLHTDFFPHKFTTKTA